jgi:chromosome segregation ATPase
MKKITIITSGLSIIVLAAAVNTVEAQRPRPILNGPDLNQAGEVRTGIIQRAQNVRADLQEGYQERRIDLQENREERRENVKERREGRQENRVEHQQNVAERRDERRAKLQSKIEERKQNLETRRAEMLANLEARKTQLTDQRKERVEGLFNNIFTGLSNAASRFESVHERIDSRITELEDAGEYIGEARSLLDTAESLLNDTVAEIEAVQTELDEAIEGEITKEYVRELVEDIKESIKATQEAYRAVIAEINQ